MKKNSRYAQAATGARLGILGNTDVLDAPDRQYWSGIFADGYIMPASPRTIRLAATFPFR